MRMKTTGLLIFLLLLLHLVNAQQSEPQNLHRVLIFHSGFEPGSKVIAKGSGADITGTDSSFVNHNDWVNDLDNNPDIGFFNLQFQGGDSTMRYAKIIAEPGNPNNHVLEFWLNEANVEGKKGRIQANLYGNKGMKEFGQSERIFLLDDFNTVRTFPDKIDWLTIAEFWNNVTWDQNVPYGFRITLGIGKPVVTESDLYFILDAQDCQLFSDDRQKYTTIWSRINKNVKVPIGKWFTLEYYYKEGDAQHGRFYMTMQPEGGKKEVIFDVTGFTCNTKDPKPDGVTDFCPIKLYTSKQLIDFMRSKGKTLQIYWDDFRLWENKRR